MEFDDLVKNRRSVRKYQSLPVDKQKILKVLDAANWAPSAMNRQPWEFLVVSGTWIERLGDSYRAVVEEFTRSSNQNDDRSVISNKEFIRFASVYGGAPVVIFVLAKLDSAPNEQKANIESASAAMENLVLAAANIGLGTCWMTGPLRDESSLRSLLHIPDNKEIVAVTPLGYPDIAPKPLPRKDPDLTQKITWLS